MFGTEHGFPPFHGARNEYHHAVIRIIKTLYQHIYFSLELLDEWGFCYQPANAQADELLYEILEFHKEKYSCFWHAGVPRFW